MKKLLTLTLSIALASAVNAASFAWGFDCGEILGPAGYTDTDGFLNTGYAVLYINSVEIARAPQGLDYKFGSFDYSATDSTGKVQELDRGDISSSFTGQEFKLVLRTNDDKYEIVYTGTSSYEEIVKAVGEDTYNYETFTTQTAYTADAWTAVPEPTSGLLLLLGMAGLALKRKQA